ncbi:MAG: hypothetical protein V8S95_01640 [Odoribacter sp.]
MERVKRFGFTTTELERVKTNMLVGLESAYKEKDKTDNEKSHPGNAKPLPGTISDDRF